MTKLVPIDRPPQVGDKIKNMRWMYTYTVEKVDPSSNPSAYFVRGEIVYDNGARERGHDLVEFHKAPWVFVLPTKRNLPKDKL